MSVRSDTTLHLDGYWPKGIGQVFTSGGKRWSSIQLVADEQSVSALGEVSPLGMVKTALEAAEGVARQATADELTCDTITRHEARRLAFRLIRYLTDTDPGAETDGLNRLARDVLGERWPTVAEVAGEVYAPSCGQAGCSPAWPCEVCQSLAGATGGEPA